MTTNPEEDKPRLIERAFPLEQTSIDSVHEKNVRHGHISTLHIWPARRPLAACRAALIATLLPDPGTSKKRQELCERIAGKVVERVKKKKATGGKTVEEIKRETTGGILHWARESSADLNWFRSEIKKAYGGRAPRVLDPFAGGGAIPLEAMRLGCQVTAVDINPVAWFLLKCTLEYPQRLAGKKHPLPEFILRDREFMAEYFKGQGYTGRNIDHQLSQIGLSTSKEGFLKGMSPDAPRLEADLSWHVRAWGKWVAEKAGVELEEYYPVVDGKPTVAYLWARTVKCKNCRAEIPLLKTLWLCKRGEKRILLTMTRKKDGKRVEFGIRRLKKANGGNDTQRRENERKLGQGTMLGKRAWCPCCGKPGSVAMEAEDIQQEGLAGRMGNIMTAVVVDSPDGKDYRLPTKKEIARVKSADSALEAVFENVPYGIPDEPLTRDAKNNTWCTLYGLDQFRKLFSSTQLLSLGTFVVATRSVPARLRELGYPPEWNEPLLGLLALAIGRLSDACGCGATWANGGEFIRGSFMRFAIPLVWDYCELNPLSDTSGNYLGAIEWVSRATAHTLGATGATCAPQIRCESAATREANKKHFDVVMTDPPYYSAIGYSVVMDYFYVWHRRCLSGLVSEGDQAFGGNIAPKWRHDISDGELVDDSVRFNNDRFKSKAAYEDGMARAFERAHSSLKDEGTLVVVFAHKEPDAWETLVSAIIRAGFVVVGSWPIQTERKARTRSIGSAALSSSVWLVCRKRDGLAKSGWDNRVLEEMRERINQRLREYWEANIRGPDFVWSATGPALEAYSKHPVVKKANEPGKRMDVGEFLRAVRRLVVEFVVSRVLSKGAETEPVSGLDDVTTYYLLHRHDFAFDDAPIGPCILYAVSCGLSDGALADQHELLIRTGGKDNSEEDDVEAEEGAEVEEGSGSKVCLRPWNQRKRKSLGLDAEGRPAPLIDQIHRLMQLWKGGDILKVDSYIEDRTLRKNALFSKVLQALIELAPKGSEERSILESLSNHVAVRGVAPDRTKDMFETKAREDADDE